MTFNMRKDVQSDDDMKDELRAAVDSLSTQGASQKDIARMTQELADELMADATSGQGAQAQVELRQELRDVLDEFESRSDIQMFQIANVLDDFEEWARHQSYQNAFHEEASPASNEKSVTGAE